MGKARKQSLASRKRAKDFSSALAENAYAYDPRTVEKFDDAAIPRSMRTLMRSMQLLKEGKPTLHRSREDLPSPAGPSARGGKKRKRGATDPPADAAGAVADAAPRQRRQEEEARPARSAPQARAAPQAGKAAAAAARPAARARRPAKAGPSFGETNERPPELLLSGKLAAKAAKAANEAKAAREAKAVKAAAAVTSAQSRALELQRAAVLQNYASARAKRAGGEAARGAPRQFAAPFMSFPT
ncbi:hypothetical protein AB1Y20_015887 [Prymnesium parvum]|uniref:Ribosome biogenesis protein NOP53 n=1 Tax=Prymnesium parvum TaxID=97485 RepID=A0AB34JYD3_PRYPA